MPITVNELIKKAGLNPENIKHVKWENVGPTPKEIGKKQAISENPGVYIVSLSDDPAKNETIAECPVDMEILQDWIDKRNGFTLDEITTHDANAIKERIEQFWLPNENILYIGKTDSSLKKRISAYHRHKYGKKSPHAGGHWIKMLKNIDNLNVYYIECSDCENIESKLLDEFASEVTGDQKEILSNPAMPFANLEIKSNGCLKRKQHEIGNMKD